MGLFRIEIFRNVQKGVAPSKAIDESRTVLIIVKTHVCTIIIGGYGCLEMDIKKQ